MSRQEKSSPRVARTASKVLRDASASPLAKSLAGSALAQVQAAKSTSAQVASKAARALDDGRARQSTKTLAGSVLTQKK